MFITNMKHLTDYIKECIEIEQVNESSEKWFRLDISKFEGAYDSLKSLADEKSLYNEPIDGGIKIKVKEGQDVELPAVIEAIQDFINTKTEDEEAQDTVARLNGYIDEMKEVWKEKKPQLMRIRKLLKLDLNGILLLLYLLLKQPCLYF